MDHLMTPNEQNEIVEDALRSYPLAQMPKDFTESVLARIRNTPISRFQITSTDYLLAVVLTLVLGAILLGLQSLPPYALIQLRIQGILVWQSILVNYRWFLPLTSILLGTSLAALAFYQLLRQQSS